MRAKNGIFFTSNYNSYNTWHISTCIFRRQAELFQFTMIAMTSLILSFGSEFPSVIFFLFYFFALQIKCNIYTLNIYIYIYKYIFLLQWIHIHIDLFPEAIIIHYYKIYCNRSWWIRTDIYLFWILLNHTKYWL